MAHCASPFLASRSTEVSLKPAKQSALRSARFDHRSGHENLVRGARSAIHGASRILDLESPVPPLMARDLSVFEQRRFRPVAPLNLFDRLVVLGGSFSFDIDLILIDLARCFVGLF